MFCFPLLLISFRCCSWFSFLDDDECTNGANECHADSLCSNTKGSYGCTCLRGYTGDGFSCAGAFEYRELCCKVVPTERNVNISWKFTLPTYFILSNFSHYCFKASSVLQGPPGLGIPHAIFMSWLYRYRRMPEWKSQLQWEWSLHELQRFL